MEPKISNLKSPWLAWCPAVSSGASDVMAGRCFRSRLQHLKDGYSTFARIDLDQTCPPLKFTFLSFIDIEWYGASDKNSNNWLLLTKKVYDLSTELRSCLFTELQSCLAPWSNPICSLGTIPKCNSNSIALVMPQSTHEEALLQSNFQSSSHGWR